MLVELIPTRDELIYTDQNTGVLLVNKLETDPQLDVG